MKSGFWLVQSGSFMYISYPLKQFYLHATICILLCGVPPFDQVVCSSLFLSPLDMESFDLSNCIVLG